MIKRALLLAAAFAPAVQAATQAELDTARDKAVAWLIRSQQPDGRWVSANGLDVHTTAAVVEALAAAGQTRLPAFAAGVVWLQNAEAGSIDALSRQIIALKKSGTDVAVTRLAARLAASRNDVDRLWGAYPGYAGTVPDTPIALLAMQATATAVTELPTVAAAFDGAKFPVTGVTGQSSWLYRLAGTQTPREAYGESVFPTAVSVLALKAHAIAAASMGEGIAFLKARQMASGENLGGFVGGDGAYSPFDTAYAADALAATSASGRADAAVQNALDFLKRKQDAAGSWSANAWTTAAALKTVATASTAAADTDGDGISDRIEAILGSDPTLADSKTLVPAVPGLASPIYIGLSNQALSYYGLRGKALSYTLPVTDAATCCSVVTGTLPAGVSVTGNGATPAVLKLAGTPVASGIFNAEIGYRSTAGTDKRVALNLEIDRTVLRADTDPFSLATLFAADAALNKLRSGWTAVADDFNADGQADVLAYFNGANELFNRLNCSTCTAYTGPEWGQLVGFQGFNGTLARVTPLVASVRFAGDLRSAHTFDFNNDGKRDVLLVLNRVTTTSADAADKATTPLLPLVLLRNDAAAGGLLSFTDVTTATGLNLLTTEGEAAVVDANLDGAPDIVVAPAGAAARLYVFNRSTGKFEDKTTGAGLGILKKPVAVDFDRDGARTVDIVSLDAATGVKVWRNNGNGSFTALANETDLSALAARRFNRIVAQDINGDIWPDLVLFETALVGSGATQAYAGSRVAVLTGSGLNASSQARLAERAASVLTDVSNLADEVNTGGTVADIDNDGRMDIVLAARDPSAAQPSSVLFKQIGDGSFIRLAAESGLPAGVTAFDSPIALDWNQDGALDLLYANSSNTAYRLLNDVDANNGIDVVLKGKAANRSALGARVRVVAWTGTQEQQLQANHGSSGRLHFGLGGAETATMTVTWPDGTQQTLEVFGTNRTVTVIQPN